MKPDLVISSLTGNMEHQLTAHKYIADYLQKSSGRCIFLSSANVFDGIPNISHSEKDQPFSISKYGQFKYKCEVLLLESLKKNALVIRLPRTLSANSAQGDIKQLESGIPVHSNLYMSLNTAQNVANAILYCIEAKKTHILHLSSTDIITEKEYTESLMLHLGKKLSFKVDVLTLSRYCELLGCEKLDLVQCNDNGTFYLALESTDTEVKEKFKITCADVVLSL